MRALHARRDKICVELFDQSICLVQNYCWLFLSNIIADSYHIYVIFKNHVQKNYNGFCALDEKLIIVKFYSQNKVSKFLYVFIIFIELKTSGKFCKVSYTR